LGFANVHYQDSSMRTREHRRPGKTKTKLVPRNRSIHFTYILLHTEGKKSNYIAQAGIVKC